VCPLGKVPYPELPARIADFLIFRENIDLSLIMGIYRNDMYLGIRSLRRKVDSAELMRKIIHGYGTGGGHEIMAGGKIPDVSPEEETKIEDAIKKRLLKTSSLKEDEEVRFV
jgi:nanoRNase/pAp phosphatase (c-di-AMP/oligoRNAs hydrolase)